MAAIVIVPGVHYICGVARVRGVHVVRRTTMNPWNRPTAYSQSQPAAVDAGLRSYMLKVYNLMASGILLSAIVAYVAGTFAPVTNLLVGVGPDGRAGLTLLGMAAAFAPLGLAVFMMFRLRSMTAQGLQTLFWTYAGVMGLSLFSIFLVYTQASILKVFLITAGTFGLLSIYGYTTKRDLTSWGTFLFVGLWAVLITSVVNMFLHSSGLDLALSYIAIALALGLTAYDTQKIKDIYYAAGYAGEDALKRASTMGALNLYFDFIYLFINLLRVMGDRR